jgi:hypothetical protein
MPPLRQPAVAAMTPVNQEPDERLVAVPPRRKAMAEQLHGLIVSLIAYQRRQVSLRSRGAQRLADFFAAPPATAAGEGCINVKPDAGLPVAAVTQVIRHAIEHSQPA